MVELKRVGVLSMAKLEAVLMGAFGLLSGLAVAFASVLGSLFSQDLRGMLGMGVGLLAVIAFPIFYAVMGFIAGAIGAFVYNLLAGVVGGIQLELVERSGSA